MLPKDEVHADEIENGNDGEKTLSAIDASGEMLARKEWDYSIFGVTGANIYNPIVDWNVCTAYWAQKDKHENGLIRITFLFWRSELRTISKS